MARTSSISWKMFQYKSSGIFHYEHVVRQGYVGTGGFETTKEFMAKMVLKPGQEVLDVGCGIGGGDFYMAETFDVHVVGIDLLVNMISFALEHAIGLNCSVEFEVTDCTTMSYPLLTSFTAVTIFSTSKTSHLCLRHSSSGLNQVEEFSSTITRVLKLRLQYSQST